MAPLFFGTVHPVVIGIKVLMAVLIVAVGTYISTLLDSSANLSELDGHWETEDRIYRFILRCGDVIVITGTAVLPVTILMSHTLSGWLEQLL